MSIKNKKSLQKLSIPNLRELQKTVGKHPLIEEVIKEKEAGKRRGGFNARPDLASKYGKLNGGARWRQDEETNKE